MIVTQGKRGGILYEGTEFRAYPAVPVKTVDLYGVGDVFCGAFAYGLLRGFESYRCCLFASAVAALKCTKRGARTGLPSCEEVVRYLKKLGYDGFEKDIK